LIEAGRRLGSYEILSPLGAGGMGEVYRARDPRLERDVAIKVLPPELATDVDRRARFEREAKAASSLNHPNIVTVHETGQSDGLHYLVMELVDGSSLRDLLAGGALPLKKALPIAAQVADGLAKAHEAGLVHRDLKPENLMVTRDGYAKVLDFGLAKAAAPALSGSQTATIEKKTASGTVLGTVGYMSPEQAAGRPVDYRSDLFSFGCVLYEMLSGRRAFSGDTAVDTLAAILHNEPEPLPAELPDPVRWIVERCLAKEPHERYAATRDLARDLKHLSQLPSSSRPTQLSGLAPSPSLRRRRLTALLAAGAVALLGAGAFWAGRRSGEHAPPRLRRLSYRRGTIWSGRFAPDGSTVVYAAAWDGNPPEVFSTSIAGSLEARALGFGSADVGAVSSSGELAVLLGRRHMQGREVTGTLARVSLNGGAPREVLLDVREAEYLPDGNELLVVTENDARVRLRLLSGAVLYETDGWISHLRLSPDGRRVAFLEHPVRRDDRGRVRVLDVASKKTLFTGPEWPTTWGLAWGPGGREVWAAAGPALHAFTISGKHRLLMTLPEYISLLDVSPDGRALLSHDLSNHLILGQLTGDRAERSYSWLNQSFPVDLSADGRSLLFNEFAVTDNYGVYYRKAPDQPAVLLGEGNAMALSPDGSSALSILYTDPPKLQLLPTGAGAPRTLPAGPIAAYHIARFFPDGKRVFFAASERGRGVRGFVQELAGGDPKPITPEGLVPQFGQVVSPDNRRVAGSLTGKGTFLFPVEGGEPAPQAGVEPGEVVLQFADGGRSVLVAHLDQTRLAITRVDLATGARSPFRELAPSDPAGNLGIAGAVFAAKSDAYVYGLLRVLSNLFVVEGLR